MTKRLQWYVAALIVLPLLVLLRQDNTLFTPIGDIDPWCYLGFFRNLVEFKRELFFGTYFGSRLAWVLPGWAAHALLSPVKAAVVLHLVVLWTAVLSLFFLLRRLTGERVAFLAALVFGFNPQMWEAAGWDYVDGAGIAYCLLTMALLVNAALRPRAWMLLLAGMSLAAMVYTNIYWVVLAPLLPLVYFALTWRGMREAIRFCLWFGAGCLAVTLAFSFINLAIDGHFWFYAPSVLTALQLGNSKRWESTVWTEWGLVRWVWLHCVGAAAALWVLLNRNYGRTAKIFAAQMALVSAYMAFMQVRGSQSVGVPWYASYLLPFAFPAMAFAFLPAVEKLSERTYWLTCTGFTVLAAAIWADHAGHIFFIWPTHATAIAAAGVLLFAAALVLQERPAGAWLALAALALWTSQTRFGALADGHAYRNHYERVMQAREALEQARHGGPLRIWYGEKEAPAPDYIAFASTYMWSYSMIGASFPQGDCDPDTTPGTVVAVASALPDMRATAESKLAKCWSPFGLRPALAQLLSIHSPMGAYQLALIRAVNDGVERRPLAATLRDGKQYLSVAADAKPLDPQQWRKLPGARIIPVRDGVGVNSPPGMGARAVAWGPIVVPNSGRYLFRLRARGVDGAVAFGARGAVTTTPGHQGEHHIYALWIDLQAGDELELVVANNQESGRVLGLVLEDLTAAWLQR